jgi:UDP-N-acetylmuramyl pentapeptide phosphotransferase/UDP-N-acetylglucosamine-1-phosphate transferase
MSDAMTAMWIARGAMTAAFSAVACVILIVILRPALRRYALAKPNARSSHREPTPQGGGIAVIAATIAASWVGTISLDVGFAAPLVVVFAALIGMACVGAVDDVHTIEIVPRLLLQALAVAAVIYALPDQLRVVPAVPWWLERIALFMAGLWFINLVNFMDGLDWMTVAEVVPITAALVATGYLGALAPEDVVMALALGGAMIGFAYFNRPVAKLFLGDVGSLPIGLLLGWLLMLLAGHGNLAAALLLPLYYLADTSITLMRRLWCRERFWEAHRTHFYQRAGDRGFTVTEIVARVFAVNLSLAALALLTVVWRGLAFDTIALCCGALLVGWLLHAFSRGRAQHLAPDPAEL